MKRTEVLYLDKFFIYKNFIEECKTKQYSENSVLHKHHIIPKCLKSDIPDKYNTVIVDVNDHIKAHLLLADCFTEGSYEKISNLRAVKILNKASIKDKQILQELYKNSTGENNPFFGKSHSSETKQRLREATIAHRKNKTYEMLYNENAALEKNKRAKTVKKVWKNRTQLEKKKIIEKAKLSKSNLDFTGGKNPNARTIFVNDIKYDSLIEALKALNTSRYKLFKHYKITYK